MRAFILLITLFVFASSGSYSQWLPKFISDPMYDGVISGWMNFKKSGNTWENRMYSLDATSFNIMSDIYSNTVEFKYNFTPEEITAGYQLYSLRNDVTGDDIVDFYIVSYWGMSSNYRKSFKIIDIISGLTVFEMNDPSFSFSTPVVWDVDNDKMLECVFTKSQYPSGSYYYQQVFSTGNPVSGLDSDAPVSFELKQNYPNPFNPSTSIEFSLMNPSEVKIEIFDAGGSLVRSLLNEFRGSGNHRIVWNGLNEFGIQAASGVYFYNLRTSESSETKKMIVLR